MKRELIEALALILIVAVFSAGSGYWFGKRQKAESVRPADPVYIEDGKVVVDTVVVEKPVKEVIYKFVPAKKETVYVVDKVNDSFIPMEKSTIDTTLTADGVTYGRLWVDFYHAPYNYFSIDFIPARMNEKIVTRYVSRPLNQKWYNNKFLWLSAGIVSGIIINK